MIEDLIMEFDEVPSGLRVTAAESEPVHGASPGSAALVKYWFSALSFFGANRTSLCPDLVW
jgi:hypothetical protein